MRLVVRAGRVEGRVRAPPSKSYTHRAFVAAALAGGGTVTNALLGDDTRATLACLAALGTTHRVNGDSVVVSGEPRGPAKGTLDVTNSGTTLRLLTGVAALAVGPTRLTGDESIRRRPMGPLLEALEALGCGAKAEGPGGRPPVLVTGPMRGGRVALAGDVSSQFVSSLLMAAPRAAEDTEVRLSSPLKSRPYVDVTLEVMRHHGVRVDAGSDGFRLEGRQTYARRPYRVPGDFSSAAFLLVAAAVTGGDVTVEGLDVASAQGDRAVLGHLRAAGADVEPVPTGVRCRGPAPGGLQAFEADLGDTPDLFPILAVLAACARGKTRLHGAPHLRFKESDRIAAMADVLTRMGADVTPTDDGAVVRGPTRLQGASLATLGDHRVLMAGAVAGLAAEGPVILDEAGSHAVSYPRFVDDMRGLGAAMEVSA